ncbi:DNA-directed RNA polymerase V subunit 7 [Nicotiana tabacum]
MIQHIIWSTHTEPESIAHESRSYCSLYQLRLPTVPLRRRRRLSSPSRKGHLKMYLKSRLSWNVIIPAENLDIEGLMLQKAIVVRLLEDFASKKATKNLGYFIAVTTMEKIGEGKVRQHTGDVLFPVDFSCITFNIFRGEILEGVVHKILKHGVFLRCGPTDKIYLSHQKMSDYKYVPGENPIFMNEKMSRIERDTVVRFIVVGARYVEAEKEFQAVVSLEGDYLGPISQSSV